MFELLSPRRITFSWILQLFSILILINWGAFNSRNSHANAHEPNLPQSPPSKQKSSGVIAACPSDAECSSLGYPCISCLYNPNCTYGENVNVTCNVLASIECKGEKTFTRLFVCQFCYQTDPSNYTCAQKRDCKSVASPRDYYKTNCSVKSDIMCLGSRTFLKFVPCKWSGGFEWSTALLLSITLGGFGADRFYLGHWQEGIGKLFSFGGLGVWTLVDVVLIWLRYLGPADGSLYL